MNLNIASVKYRFTRDMIETYHQMFKDAQQQGRKTYIYASPEAREKIRKTFLSVFTNDEMDELIINPHPTNYVSAAKLGRGMTDHTVIFIDEKGIFADTIKKTLAPLKNINALIVHNEYNDER